VQPVPGFDPRSAGSREEPLFFLDFRARGQYTKLCKEYFMAKQKKSANVKRSDPKKSAKAASQKKGSSAQRARLERELKAYVAKIDEEGLIFLLKQAHVILHNMEVDKINREIVELEGTKQKGKSKTAGTVVSRSLVEIKPSSDNKSFIIVFDNSRKIFDLQEMRRIVAICQAARSDIDASSRLYAWFSQNRKDVLGDVGIGSARHPVLPELYRLVKRTYTTGK
jgi:hypothetical protein